MAELGCLNLRPLGNVFLIRGADGIIVVNVQFTKNTDGVVYYDFPIWLMVEAAVACLNLSPRPGFSMLIAFSTIMSSALRIEDTKPTILISFRTTKKRIYTNW
jgi:hypothetical protein